MRFRSTYALAALLLLLVELGIGLFVHDRVVRPYLGDSLAVVLLHLALRAVTRLGIFAAAANALLVACAIELGQYFHLIDLLGLRANLAARLVLGTGFDPADFVAYVAGMLGVLAVDITTRRREPRGV